MARLMTFLPRIATVAAFGLVAGCGGPAPIETATASETVVILSPNDVAEVRMADVASGVFLTGTLEPSESVSVRSQTAGVLRQLTVDRGSAVKRGQRLGEIQAEAVESQVTGAEAAVAAAKSAIAAAEAALAAAKQKLEGARTLFEAGALSRVDFQSAEAQTGAAAGQLAGARAQQAAAEAQLVGAREMVGRTAVDAPISGVVSERKVSQGEAVGVGTDLLTIVNLDVLILAGQVPVQQAPLVRAGQVVTFTLDAYPGQTFSAKVGRVDPVADPATRRVGITLHLPNPGHRLVSGQFVTGRVITANVAQALVVPRTALRGEHKAPYVLLVDGDTIVQRDLQVGMFDDAASSVVVLGGLKEGDRVIASPALDVQPGAKVRAAAEAPAKGSE
jgi:membrane fusion protein (multidrug efflux system)